jgi:DNA uptake protein ComE-like DNA-binding protein
MNRLVIAAIILSAGLAIVVAPAIAAPPLALAQAQLIDVNSASAEQLKTLDGIGDARAAAIIKGRPYANKTQLVAKEILPQAVYYRIADKIVARQR